jgi:leucyl-tRNA synthetase
MSEKYNPQEIENKWQAQWEAKKLYRSEVDWDKPKHYALTMLPYPSGDLHIGHWFAMTPSDARARYMRMKGFNVLFPMGFDAFGLPAENAAVQRNIHPATWTYANMDNMRRQLHSMGMMVDWQREAVSCDPSYYKWTEWFFSQLYKNDLAYRSEALVNWSEALGTVLANEQVIDGKDERLGQPVIQKMMTQWFFSVTKYADELLDFGKIDWPEPVKIMQTNWIGRSEGAHVTFKTEGGDPIEVFTTRPDTLWGATFMVLAPEHSLLGTIVTDDQRQAVDAYIEQAAAATEIERSSETREKTGIFTGAYAINPVNQAKVPIWVADYVMITYGSGAIMAVPAHDERDFAFARKFDIEIIPVIQAEGEQLDGATMEEATTGGGVMINSAQFNGTAVTDQKGRKNPGISKVIDWLEADGIGKEAINYRLRDWLISRQRYWGAPIPMIHRADGGVEATPDDQLPVVLPEDVEFTGRNPLTISDDYKNTVDSDGNPAQRETDTMDTFMCSSWYQYRYLSPDYDGAPFDPEEAAYWLPVDVYTGGAEHATMHLMYTRFFTKAMRDMGVFDDAAKIMKEHGRDPEGMFDEPMTVVRNQGQVLGAERTGDILWVKGTVVSWEDAPQRISRVVNVKKIKVVESAPESSLADEVVGELIRRTEYAMWIRTEDGDEIQVTANEKTKIDIPGIPPVGDKGYNVNQLKHHLEIQRMSKSKGNVVDPDALVERYGADVVRSYLMFNFDWQKGGPWNDNNIKGPAGWIQDVWNLVNAGAPEGEGDAEVNRDVERKMHQAIDGVETSLETFSFNTAISAQMKFKNAFRDAIKTGKVGAATWTNAVDVMLRLMSPFAPHVAEELWERAGFGFSVHLQDWPEYDAEKAAEDRINLVVMIMGKPRENIKVSADIEKDAAIELALVSEAAQRALDGGEPKRVIFIAARKGQEPKVNIVV